jgi:hypothetical protein
MKRFFRIAAMAGGFSGLSLAFGAGAVRTVRAQSAPPPAPEASFVVPVSAQQSGPWSVSLQGTPTVSIGNSPIVNAQQTGPWTVGLAGGTTVGLTPGTSVSIGGPLMIRSEADHPQQPVFAVLDDIMLDTGVGATTGLVYTVPAGQRLVIERISVRVLAPAGQSVLGSVTLGINSRSLELPLHDGGFYADHGPSGGEIFVGGESMHVLLDANGAIYATVERNASTGQAFGNFHVTGYLVSQ